MMSHLGSEALVVLASLGLACTITEDVGTRGQEIMSGTVDSTNIYSNVGAMMVEYEGDVFPICSGTLIAPTVFLTASHCTIVADMLGLPVSVSFEPVATTQQYPGVAYTHPEFGRRGQNDPHDIAVIVLDQAPEGIAPAALPPEGMFSQGGPMSLLDTRYRAVGYGVFDRSVEMGIGKVFEIDDTRRYADSSYLSRQRAWLTLSQNANTGDGGTCYGDSGGPNFFEDTNIIAGLTVTGDMECRATNKIYRVDTPVAREFLSAFVDLP